MKVLIIGNGGREHALAWCAARSPHAERVFVAPGNPGTAAEPGVENVAVGATDTDLLLDFARRERVDLTIVGPEAALAAGIVDRFTAAGLKIFGPTAAAARLETSKAFAKDFLRRHHIPTADYAVCDSAAAADAYVREHPAPLVIKADGLAAGKGVIIAPTTAAARDAVRLMMTERKFGAAADRVVIEQFMSGEEASFIVMTDGTRVLPWASSQDHKRWGDGDTGLNTGGMGAYSPAPVVTPAVRDKVLTEIIEPILAGMRAEGCPYRGFLYAGLMIDAAGQPRVVEINCRLGDPETQPLLMRLRSDLVELAFKACEPDGLRDVSLSFDPRPAVGVIMSAAGYPGTPRKGDEILGLAPAADPAVKIFHGGTSLQDGRLVTAGGRVLCVTALGDDIRAARDRAYRAVAGISFAGSHYRRDIAWRALQRERDARTAGN